MGMFTKGPTNCNVKVSVARGRGNISSPTQFDAVMGLLWIKCQNIFWQEAIINLVSQLFASASSESPQDEHGLPRRRIFEQGIFEPAWRLLSQHCISAMHTSASSRKVCTVLQTCSMCMWSNLQICRLAMQCNAIYSFWSLHQEGCTQVTANTPSCRWGMHMYFVHAAVLDKCWELSVGLSQITLTPSQWSQIHDANVSESGTNGCLHGTACATLFSCLPYTSPLMHKLYSDTNADCLCNTWTVSSGMTRPKT